MNRCMSVDIETLLLNWITGINYEINQFQGFSTDISETCVWITPLVKKPADPQYFE